MCLQVHQLSPAPLCGGDSEDTVSNQACHGDETHSCVHGFRHSAWPMEEVLLREHKHKQPTLSHQTCPRQALRQGGNGLAFPAPATHCCSNRVLWLCWGEKILLGSYLSAKKHSSLEGPGVLLGCDVFQSTPSLRVKWGCSPPASGACLTDKGMGLKL